MHREDPGTIQPDHQRDSKHFPDTPATTPTHTMLIQPNRIILTEEQQEEATDLHHE